MELYDERKEKKIDDYDRDEYKIMPFKRFVAHHEAIEAQPRKTHIEVLEEFPNGSKSTIEVVDNEAIEAKEAYDEYEDCFYIVHLDSDERKGRLRERREAECFSVLDRGRFWYDGLSEEETESLKEWYEAWLNVTETGKIPEKPKWLEGKL